MTQMPNVQTTKDEPKGFIDEAVDFWTGPDPFSNAIDAIAWGTRNPGTVAKAVKDADVKAILKKDAETVKSSVFGLAKYIGTGIIVIAAAYVALQTASSYAKEKARKAAK